MNDKHYMLLVEETNSFSSLHPGMGKLGLKIQSS